MNNRMSSQFNVQLNLSPELVVAYDATPEVWAAALEKHDREDEGHTLRVTQMTMRLAQAMGVSDQELVHIRRGAQLHDIGNMGMPESILYKQGELTHAEWRTIQLHPFDAYDVLRSVDYLSPARSRQNYRSVPRRSAPTAPAC